MIDYMSLPANEAERLCYAEGFENAAKLFARIDALQYALGQATAALTAIADGPMTAKQARAAAYKLRAMLASERLEDQAYARELIERGRAEART